MPGPSLTFRPHHFICTLGFQGDGYSPLFVDNYQGIVKALTDTPHTLISIQDGLDSICQACPHQLPQNRCDQQNLIQTLDHNHSHALDLEGVSAITWADAKQRIKENISPSLLEVICQGCQWLSYGWCKNALVKLKEENETNT